MRHRILEENVGLLALYMTVAVSISGLTQIVPLSFQGVINTPVKGMKPYAVLQPEDRDIYIREGCVGCHSQMIRPSRAETERYDHYPMTGEDVWDYPFPWGSKCTGPDLARVGNRYSDDRHRTHLFNPCNVVPGSKMSAYPWLVEDKLDGKDTEGKFEVMRTLGVPYTDEDTRGAKSSLKGKTEMDTVIAYLQALGIPIKNKRRRQWISERCEDLVCY